MQITFDTQVRASDNSKEKSEISRDLRRQIRGDDGQFHVNFARNFWGKFVLKSKQKNQKERYLSKRNWKDVKFRARKKHKSSSNTVLKATVLVSSDKKTTSFTEMLGWITSFFSCSLEPKTAT